MRSEKLPAPPVAPSIAKNSAFDSGAQGALVVVSLLTGIVLARALGAEGRGAYVFATSFAGMLLLSFVNLGVELSASVLAAKRPADLPALHAIVLLVAGAAAALLAPAWWFGARWITAALLPGMDSLHLALLMGVLPLWVYQYGAMGLLVGAGRVRTRSLFEMILGFLQNGAVLGLLAIGAGLGTGRVVDWLVVSYYALIAVGALVLFTIVARVGDRALSLPRPPLISRFLRYGAWVYAANLGGNLNQRVDAYFVQQVSRSEALFGIYTLATSLTQRTRIFPQALSRASYASICSLPHDDAVRLIAGTFRQMLLLSTGILLAGAAASPLIPLLYGPEFTAAIVPFLIFLVGRLFHNSGWMLANYFSGTLGRPAVATWINWGILPLQAVLAYFAMKLGGLVAVAAITSGTYLLLWGAFLVLFLRWQRVVGAGTLFRFTREDWKVWSRLFGGIWGKLRRHRKQ